MGKDINGQPRPINYSVLAIKFADAPLRSDVCGVALRDMFHMLGEVMGARPGRTSHGHRERSERARVRVARDGKNDQ